MPTFAIVRWATSRVAGLTIGQKVRNRFMRGRIMETKKQQLAAEVAGFILAVVVASFIASLVETGFDAVAQNVSDN